MRTVRRGLLKRRALRAAWVGMLLSSVVAGPAAASAAGANTSRRAVAAPGQTTSAGFAAPSNALRAEMLVTAAVTQIGRTTLYDPAYVRLAYPGGDVPINRGVCTDVIIRAFRAIGLDLQLAVHEDMVRHFSSYPRTGRSTPDANIDHRRVKNLAVFFTRSGAAVPVTQRPSDYLPGDVVMWDVGGLAHTGLVADALAPGTDRHTIVHNIGDGTQMEDILFEFPITGHFRYPAASSPAAQ